MQINAQEKRVVGFEPDCVELRDLHQRLTTEYGRLLSVKRKTKIKGQSPPLIFKRGAAHRATP
jgi:hypothetical protein